MANATHKNFLVLDTVAVGSALYLTHKIKPKSIRWTGATTSGHACILKDTAGVVRFHSVAGGAGHTDTFYPTYGWTGLEVDTLQSGIVYIEL
jgi:hypothetical protein